MLGFDLEKMMHAVTQPFHNTLEAFSSQMPEMVRELKKQNSLLEQILEQLKKDAE